MLVRGTVQSTVDTPLADPRIDVWQANDDGFHDVQKKAVQSYFNLRSMTSSVPRKADNPAVSISR